MKITCKYYQGLTFHMKLLLWMFREINSSKYLKLHGKESYLFSVTSYFRLSFLFQGFPNY